MRSLSWTNITKDMKLMLLKMINFGNLHNTVQRIFIVCFKNNLRCLIFTFVTLVQTHFHHRVKYDHISDFLVFGKYLVGLSKKGDLFRKCLFLLVSFLVASFLLSNSKQVSVFIVQAVSYAAKEQKQ